MSERRRNTAQSSVWVAGHVLGCNTWVLPTQLRTAVWSKLHASSSARSGSVLVHGNHQPHRRRQCPFTGPALSPRAVLLAPGAQCACTCKAHRGDNGAPGVVALTAHGVSLHLPTPPRCSFLSVGFDLGGPARFLITQASSDRHSSQRRHGARLESRTSYRSMMLEGHVAGPLGRQNQEPPVEGLGAPPPYSSIVLHSSAEVVSAGGHT